MRIRQCIVAAGIVLSGVRSISGQPVGTDPTLSEIAASVRSQDDAWDTLVVRYVCEDWMPSSDGEFSLDETYHMEWRVTASGMERIRRRRLSSEWTEEASFDSQYFMTFDSQGDGSGGVGHAVSSFLNISESPKSFGLYATGLELSMPMTWSEYLRHQSSQVHITEETDTHVTIRGRDPFSEDLMLEAMLSKKYGFRPTQIELSDQKGLLTRYHDLVYEQFEGSRGKFWFPVRGTWQGINPEDRSLGTRMEYKDVEVLVDTRLPRKRFILTYPKGALLLNTDTGQTVYLSDDTTTEDSPHFDGLLISMDEHDQRLAADNVVDIEKPGNGRWTVLIILNIVLVVAVVIYLAATRKSNKADRVSE